MAEEPRYSDQPHSFAMDLDTGFYLLVTLRQTMADNEHEVLLSLTNAAGEVMVAPMSDQELALLSHRIQYLLGGLNEDID